MKKLIMILLMLAMLAGAIGCAAAGSDDDSEKPFFVSNTSENLDVSDPENTENHNFEPDEEKNASLESDAVPPSVEDETIPDDASASDKTYTAKIQIEGMDEEVNYKQINGSFNYSMPMDTDRFEFCKGEATDKFQSTANEKVFMTVRYLDNTTASAEAKDREADAEAIRSEASTVEIGDYEAAIVHLVYGSEPDSKIMDYIFVEHNGGVYEINLVYFLAAAEGFGARMLYMAKDFKII